MLHECFEKVFDELELVLGWENGYDPSCAVPAFIRKKEDLKRLIWNPLCSTNLSGYLVKFLKKVTNQEGKKIWNLC